MKNFIKIITGSVFLLWSTAQADIQIGVGLIAGQTDVSGTETEGTAADTSDRSKTLKEAFVGADVFAEYVTDSGMTYGVSFVPVDVELGEGSRTDVAAVSENDAGTRTASAVHKRSNGIEWLVRSIRLHAYNSNYSRDT